ncbi:hypothetical protein MKSMC1_53320 [Mycobacterium kansasii]|nr:hypothetical protein MKSMC1_53320 [Mycobacterium kansasii]
MRAELISGGETEKFIRGNLSQVAVASGPPIDHCLRQSGGHRDSAGCRQADFRVSIRRAQQEFRVFGKTDHDKETFLDSPEM